MIYMYIMTGAFYLITSNGQTEYLLVSDVFLAKSWILLANKKKNTLSEQFQNQTEKNTEIGKIGTYNTYMYIHDRSLSWIVTGI